MNNAQRKAIAKMYPKCRKCKGYYQVGFYSKHVKDTHHA